MASSSAADTAATIKSSLALLRRSARRRPRLAEQDDARSLASSDRDDALALDALRRAFAGLVDDGAFDPCSSGGGGHNGTEGGDGDEGGATARWRAWLSDRHGTFVGHLAEGVGWGRTASLRTFCGVLASTPEAVAGLDGNVPRVSERLLNRLLESLVRSKRCGAAGRQGGETADGDEAAADEALLSLFESEFVRPHRDVQYFVLRGVVSIASGMWDGAVERKEGEGADRDGSGGIVAENLARLLMKIDYVARTEGELDGASGFLFAPPDLSGEKDGAGEESDGEDGSVRHDDETDSESEVEGSDGEGEAEKDAGGPGKDAPKAPGPPKRATRLVSWQRPYRHRNALQEAWLAVLRLPNMPPRTSRRVLQHLSSYVLAVAPSPLRFAEYFTRSYEAGASPSASGGTSGSDALTSILALDGLFALMLDHRLEYPRFYDSLYSLLRPRVLYARHRARFLRLLSRSLQSNPMLPAYAVASFVKRLCRLGLSCPPAGGLFCLALSSNLVRRHGECACLIHRGGRNEDGGTIDDVFVEDEDDLSKTRGEREEGGGRGERVFLPVFLLCRN